MGTLADPDSSCLVDTNVILYSFDSTDRTKQSLADELIESLAENGRLCVSAQVLNETFSQLTRSQRSFGTSLAEARKMVLAIGTISTVVSIDLSVCQAAFQACEEHTLSFWDSLIWAAAKAADCSVVYSEDFQHGRVLEGVQFVNPFLPSP